MKINTTRIKQSALMIGTALLAQSAWASGYHFGTQSVSSQSTANSSAARHTSSRSSQRPTPRSSAASSRSRYPQPCPTASPASSGPPETLAQRQRGSKHLQIQLAQVNVSVRAILPALSR